MDQQEAAGAAAAAPNIKWSYMDHWSVLTPRRYVAPQLGPQYLDRFYKAIAGIGFQGVDPFEFRLNALIQHFGSAKKVLEFAQARGIERFVNIFCVFYNDMVHIRENHEGVVAAFEAKIKQY